MCRVPSGSQGLSIVSNCGAPGAYRWYSKIPPTSLSKGGVLSPFAKGGLREICTPTNRVSILPVNENRKTLCGSPLRWTRTIPNAKLPLKSRPRGQDGPLPAVNTTPNLESEVSIC